MNPREWFSLLLRRKGGRFLDFEVDGSLICNVQPLGTSLTPGVTKVGRLSFMGSLDGKRVKLYTCFSEEQVKLRCDLGKHRFYNFSFPSILAYDGLLVVEDWVDGEVVKPGSNCESSIASKIINELHQLTPRLDRRSFELSPFCYFEDYLLARLERWRVVRQISDFVSSWEKMFHEVEPLICPRLCHPDLNPRNMVKCSESGRVFVVDNELLGVGRGWILDWHNAGLPENSEFAAPRCSKVEEFVSLSWRLRRLGSMLDASDFKGVKRVLRG